MIKKQILAFLFIALSIVSCSKDEPTPAIAFTQAEGKAINGEYTITGTITSSVALLKVIITKEGSATPFIVDDSTAKNKNNYPYSYLITGITKDTYVIIDVYDQNNTKTSTRFLIRV